MSSTDDFLAALDAEFGKKKKERSAPNKQPFKQPGDSAGKIANAIAHSETFAETWKAEAREIWIMYQHCVCCQRVTEHIAGEYVRYRSNRKHATLTRRDSFNSPEYLQNPGLAREVRHMEQDVSTCPSCIHEEKRFDEIWDSISRPVAAAQLELLIPGIDLIEEEQA